MARMCRADITWYPLGTEKISHLESLEIGVWCQKKKTFVKAISKLPKSLVYYAQGSGDKGVGAWGPSSNNSITQVSPTYPTFISPNLWNEECKLYLIILHFHSSKEKAKNSELSLWFKKCIAICEKCIKVCDYVLKSVKCALESVFFSPWAYWPPNGA